MLSGCVVGAKIPTTCQKHRNEMSLIYFNELEWAISVCFNIHSIVVINHDVCGAVLRLSPLALFKSSALMFLEVGGSGGW